ncbi:hypothetical protein [Klenkia brasiliensis]|uniref:Excreted virulence factor EspC, type VII ESX diderm n=1 Tax=Klenkia brasiliensis TaxID=333142 RepID=A0A1G7QHR7_9ACTN|nr:hypothetical protein [Klenkia brasiliensis]SDF98063.1 hypothetical protein SAMN05660324_1489 [Klenkia brasiliensis]
MSTPNSGNSVSIDPAQAEKGLAEWDTAEGALTRSVGDRLAAIRGMEAAKPWGGDSGGQAFEGEGRYPENSAAVAAAMHQVTGQIGEQGRGARTAVTRSLASDAEQAAQVAPVEGQVSGAGTPGS